MLRGQQVRDYAERHGLVIVSVAALADYTRRLAV